MKAFWWFKENSIAGMARPGFNYSRWFDFEFQDALAVGWVGKTITTEDSLENYRKHILEHGPKIAPFYGLDNAGFAKEIEIFETEAGVTSIFERVIEKTKVLENFSVQNGKIQIQFNREQLKLEIEQLKENGIQKIVSLTEHHHDRVHLTESFDAHHISIEDLGAPTIQQVDHLAEILIAAKENNEKTAVHCLAGIGRTSTMLISAHIKMGEKLPELEALLKKQNPYFILTGQQGEFIRSLAQ